MSPSTAEGNSSARYQHRAVIWGTGRGRGGNRRDVPRKPREWAKKKTDIRHQPLVHDEKERGGGYGDRETFYFHCGRYGRLVQDKDSQGPDSEKSGVMELELDTLDNSDRPDASLKAVQELLGQAPNGGEQGGEGQE